MRLLVSALMKQKHLRAPVPAQPCLLARSMCSNYKPVSRLARKKEQQLQKQQQQQQQQQGGQPASKATTASSSSASSSSSSVGMDAEAQEYFLAEAEDMLSDISDAIEPILSLNPGYKINRIASDHLEVICGDGGGTYVFRVDHSMQVIGCISPVSGVNKYLLDPEEGLWLGVSDGHDLRGLIIRDFMRHCIGLPSFDSMK